MRGRGKVAAWALSATLAGGGALPAIEPTLALSELVRGHWQAESGLPQDAVTALTQTRDGFLWIGTRSGIARFDGSRFTMFDRNDLPLERTTDIQAMTQDAQGRLWIGTSGGELLRYQDGAFRLFADDEGLRVRRITALFPGRNDELWIGSYGDGLYRYANGRFEQVPHLAHPQVSSLHQAADGTLWIGSYGGGVSMLRGDRLEQLSGLPDPRVWKVLSAGRGTGVWIGTDSGLCRWEAGACRVWTPAEGLRQRQVISLHEDRHGILWFGTYGGGLHRLHADGRLEKLGEDQDGAEDIVWTIAEDDDGMIWLGTTNHGLRLFADSVFNQWQDLPGTAGNRLVTVLAEGPPGTFFVGTRDHGLFVRRDGRFESLAGPAQGLHTVWSLSWQEGVLWVGTSRGLYRWQDGALDEVPLEGFSATPVVSALLADGHTVWVGTGRGLLRLAPTGRRFLTQDDGLPSNSVRDLALDRQGRLWIATLGGLSMLEGDEVRTFRVREGLPGSNVVALHVDGDGAIWAAVAAAGLVRVEGGKLAALGARDGLLEDDLTSIAEDSLGNLWLGSSRGVTRVSKKALVEQLAHRDQPLAQTLFDRFDGFDGAGVWASGRSALAGRDGRLYFATMSGVAIFDPRGTRYRAGTPNALIDRLWVDDRAIPLDRTGPLGPPAALPAGSRRFTFGFAAPLPHAGAKVQLRHRLIELGDHRETPWVDSGRDREVSYAGLAPGRYRFEAQASSTAGLFNAQPAGLDFVVKAGFRESPRFFAILVAALALIAWLVHRARLWQLERRERALARDIDDALAAIDTLHRLLPLCGSCHKVRDDGGYWQQVESYLSSVTEAQFTHGLCPECATRMLEELDDSRTGGLDRRESA